MTEQKQGNYDSGGSSHNGDGKRRTGKGHSRGKGGSASKFTGLNKDELEGIVICENMSTPTAQQFDTLYEALLVYGGSRNAKVKTSLRKMKYLTKYDMEPPLPPKSSYTDSDGKVDTVLQMTRMEMWKSDCKDAHKIYNKYEESIRQIFETIMGQLGIEIKNNLKATEGWERIDEECDTIALLTKLKELCYRDNSNKVEEGTDLIGKLLKVFSCKQHDKTAVAYTEEITNKWDVFKAAGGYVGSVPFAKYVLKNTNIGDKTYSYKEYLELSASTETGAASTAKKIDDAIEQTLLARLIVYGSSDKHHQSLRLDLMKDFAKGHDNYPKTVSGALDLLNQFKVKSQPKGAKQPNGGGGKRGNSQDETPDNSKSKSETKANNESSKTEKSFTNVGKSERSNTGSTTKDRKTAKVNVEKAVTLLLKGVDKDEDSDEDFMFLHYGVEEEHPNDDDDVSLNDLPIPSLWDHPSLKTTDTENSCCEITKTKEENFPTTITLTHSTATFHSKELTEEADMTRAFMFAQNNEDIVDRWWLLLDSQATCNIICNRKLVKNIRTHPEERKVKVHCNAGSVEIGTVADLPGFGLVWFNEECIANCLSLALVSDKFRVTLDTAVTQGFFVHRHDGTTRRFDRADNDLYACDLKEESATMLVTTVNGQKAYYSDLDIRRAKAARRLQETMGYPSVKAFLHMIDNNMIKNCPVTRRDVKMAEDIYGVNTNIIKGKNVRRQPGHVREDHMPVPPGILERYSEVTLGIDVYHINGIRFFRSISRHLMFRVTQPIADAKAATLLKQVERTVGRYALRGFKVVQIFGDNAFNCITDKLATMGIAFSPVARGAHEPFIERDNRTSKERCRCIFNGLPFERMPLRMVMELPVAVDYWWLNYWCSSGGVSQTVPPRQIITGIVLDAAKHCKFQFGDYVLAHNETDNTMKPRANDAIYLRPTGTPDGAFYLVTARRVRKHSATLAHMTDSVIRRVHAIADEQQAPAGLTFGDFDNGITILDLDTEAPPEEDDDDDASDGSYAPEEESADTRLTGVVEEDEIDSVQSGHGYAGDEEEEDESVSTPENYTPQNVDDNNNDGDENTHEPPETEQDNDQEEIEIVFEQDDNDAEKEGSITNEDMTGGDVEEENTEEADAPRRPNLRETVTRRHPKYGESDGFSETVRHRNLFCRGFERAVQKIADDHAKIMLVSQAVEVFNHMEASLVTPQYGVKKGLELFGREGAEAVLKELGQLHNLSVISPVHPREMTREEIQKALPYLMFLKRKRCGKIKGRGCADGRPQREFISREEASSPTASVYAIILSCLIDAIEGRFVATTDIPGAFLQTDMPKDEIVHIRITGAMAELMNEIDSELYGKYIVTTKRGTKVLYAKANKAIYGTLRAALLFWEKLRGKLSEWGFEQNPYDACTMNKNINGGQATIVWHVDDLKISHRDEATVRAIIADLEEEFGKVAPLTTTYGKTHDYLGMTTIDYSSKGKVRLTMFDYLHEIIENLPESLQTNRNTTTPAADHLFEVDENAAQLPQEEAELFHSYTAKLLFAAKRARPDIQTAVAFLCTRVKSPDVDDWKKLKRLLGYVKETIFLPLTIGWDGTGNTYWYVDASFAVHNNMRSHTGAMMTFGVGATMSISTKQKINTKSSTEAELVGVDDALPFNIWCMHFLREQGYQSIGEGKGDNAKAAKFLGHSNILYQDNTSSIRLETNGKASSTKRTRHINIRYFLITDKLKRKEISSIEYCPTDEMIADYFTKPLQGSLFKRFRNAIMGVTDTEYLAYKQAYEEAMKQRGPTDVCEEKKDDG